MLYVARYLWYLSFAAFLAASLYSYIYFPDYIQLQFAEAGKSGVKLGKETFFYSSILLMIVINLLLSFLGNLTGYLPKPLVLVPKKKAWLTSLITRKILVKKMRGWFQGIGAIVNFLLLTTVWLLYSSNDTQPFFNAMPYLYLLFFMFVGWLVYFFIMFNKTKELEEVV